MPENMQNKAKADNVRKKNIPRVRCNHKNMQPLEISLKTRKKLNPKYTQSKDTCNFNNG